MLQFLKYTLATIVGLVIFLLVSFLILLGIGAASGDKVTVKSNSVLKLKFDRPITERSREDDPFTELGSVFNGTPTPVGLVQIREAIAEAKNDENIKGIYLEPDLSIEGAGYPILEEIRAALVDFKQSKKFIVAYSEIYTEKSLYLASVADKIYVNPEGIIEWNGLSSETVFLKGTLAKLGVKPEIFKVGDYKSAIEPFIRQDMSEPSREQTLSYLTSINNHLLQTIGAARGIETGQLRRLADSLTIRQPEDALRAKLVTNVGYQDEVESLLKKNLKLEEKKKIEYISLSKYLKAEKDSESGSSDNKIAVVIASGDINSGDGDDQSIGSESFVKALRKARDDEKVKAVVLRINSPGGSALASDVMWREIQLTKKKKPVVASMSTYAASGGYYMAMGCDKIVAHPTTLTGSIGIFALWFNVKELLNDKLGVTVDGAKTNTYADFGEPSRELTATERQWFQKRVDQGYESFTKKAAEGRKMTQDDLKKIASGRVWSGEQAKQNGLVDELGGLTDAIKLAGKLAKLKDNDYRLRYLPDQKSTIEQIFGDASENAQTQAMQKQLGMLAPYAKELQKLQTLQGVQARMPFEIRIK